MSDHALATCKGCGQTDNHPKVVTPDEEHHHDCLPFILRAQLMELPPVAAVIKACEGGKRGDALRKHIAKISESQEG